MKIVILGRNALSHFISSKLLEDKSVTHVYHFFANNSISPTNRYTPMPEISNIIEFLESEVIDIVFITTMNFLCDSKIQNIIKEKNIPTASCSFDHFELEWSKLSGKKLLNELGIKTTNYQVLNREELLHTYFNLPRPWVLKYDKDWRAGLQTIIITDENFQEEYRKILELGNIRFVEFHGNFSDQKFVVEEFLVGKREYSYHFICNDVGWEYLGSARDYKKFHEGDIGFNTAGMGSYAPVNINPKVHDYADKIYNSLKSKGIPYKGIMYLGIMEDSNGEPYVLEINTRPGDPELQSILSTYSEDFSLLKLLFQCANNLNIDNQFEPKNNSVSVRIVHSDYRMLVDSHLTKIPHNTTFYRPHTWPAPAHVSVSYNHDRRLLDSVITSFSSTRKDAADIVHNFLNGAEMHNYIYRKDIGYLE
jgi:phosphoribosylamine---glycine ligase